MWLTLTLLILGIFIIVMCTVMKYHHSPTLPNCVCLKPQRKQSTREEITALIESQNRILFVRNTSFIPPQWAQDNRMTLLEKLKKMGIELRCMVTPTGVVGWYDKKYVQVHVDQGEIWGQGRPTPELPHLDLTPFQLPHYQLDRGDLEIKPHHHLIARGEQYYIRTLPSPAFLPLVQDALPSCFPLDLLDHINLYLSQKGIVTNLHVDGKSGIIFQIRGRKRVLIFPPEARQYAQMYPPFHPLARRSQMDKRLTRDTLRDFPEFKKARGWEVTMIPGDYLFIPQGFLHYVESLDDDTYSVILRFQK